MLSCHKGTWYRTLTLLGLVLAFVGMAYGGWAEEKAPLVYKEVVEGAVVRFPYLSPVADQRSLLFNAFMAQKKIFYAMSGEDGGIQALKYLALVAAMLGAILIVFNAKYRRGPVLFAWLIVLVLCLFSPYGSRLLFYPVSENSYRDSATNTTISAGGSCDSKDQVCGFTPQLAGMHVASTLQLLFSDVFVSLGWTSLLDDVAARTSLERSPLLITSPEWLRKIDSYRRSCSGDVKDGWGGVIDARVAGSASESSIGVPTFGEAFRNIKDYVRDAKNSSDIPNHMYPLPAIVFYDEDTPGFKDWLENSTPDNAYANGLTYLVQTFAHVNKTVKLKGSAGFDANENVTFSEALDALKASGFFEVGYSSAMNPIDQSSGIFPGFFFVRGGDKGIADLQKAAEFRVCYRNMYQEKMLENRDCVNLDFTAPNTILANETYRQSYINSVFNEQFSYQPSGLRLWGFSYNKWPELMPLLKDDSVSIIPVGIMSFKMANADKVVAPARSDIATNPYLIKCARDGNLLADEALDWNLGYYGRAPEFKPLRNILVDKKEFGSDRLDASSVVDPVVFATEEEQDSHCNIGVLTTSSVCKTRLKNSRDLYAALERAYAGEIDRYKIINGTETVSSENRYKILFMLVLGSIESSTRNLATTSDAEARATAASKEIDIKENSENLTNWGSGVATIIGNIFIKVGSFFVGPLSATIIYFLSIFVDLALMSLIILTPVLFLAALVMPPVAIGVLTISIMGVFILKFVPVTLIIINALSRLVYITIGGAQSANSEQMKELITLAGAGLYANLIGLTFFLLFKLGDASAVLSRFTALDSNASKIADAAWNTTKALAMATAALPLVGGLAGSVGAVAGRMALNKSGFGGAANLINAARNGMVEDKLAKKGGQLKDDKGNALTDTNGKVFSAEEEEKILDNEHNITEAMKPYGDGGLGLSMQQASELYGKGSLTTAEGFEYGIGEDGKAVMKSAAASDLMLETRGDLMSSDEVNLRDAAAAKESFMVGNDRLKSEYAERDKKVLADQMQRVSDAGLELDEGQTKELYKNNTYEDGKGNVYALDQDGNPHQTRKVVEGAPKAPDSSSDPLATVSTGTGTGAGAPAGVAANVNVVGGKLDSVDTVGNEARAAESTSSEAERTRQINEKVQEQDIASAADNIRQNKETLNRLKQSDSLNDKQKAELDALATDDPNFDMKKDRILRNAGTTQGLENVKYQKALNLNQQFADSIAAYENKYAKQFAQIDEKKQNGQSLTSFEKRLVSSREEMLKRDPAGLALGQQAKALAEVERLQASIDARFGADNMPGIASSFVSGVYGSLVGGGGGLAKVPVIGPMISEAVNEYYQAPERARAARAVGGAGAWMTAQSNAKRMGFYQKEMAPLAAGEQYSQMLTVGGFQAQADIARQAATEAVARSRTQWEGMLADRKMTLENKISVEEMGRLESKAVDQVYLDQRRMDELLTKHPEAKDNQEKTRALVVSQARYDVQQQLAKDVFENGPLTRQYLKDSVRDASNTLIYSSSELAGIGRHDVAAKIGSLKSEAAVVQTASLMVETVKGGLDSNMMIANNQTTPLDPRALKTETSNVFLTPDALATLHGNASIKNSGKRNEEMMVNNYGILEKQFLRGEAKWDNTRNMAFDREAAGRFVRTDIDTDYLVGGHLNMVQGKEKFMDMRGQYESLVKYRHESNAIVSKHLREELSKLTGGIQDALKHAKVDVNSLMKFEGRDLEVMQRTALEKWAKKELKDKGVTIPLDAVFDVASVSGKAKYEKKVMTAYYDQQSQAAENWEAMQKAAADMYASMLPDAKNFTRKMSIERGGVKYEIPSANKHLFTKINKAVGEKFQTQVDKAFMDYFSKHQDEIVSTFDKKTGIASQHFTSKGWAGAMNNVLKTAGQDAVNMLMSQLSKKDGAFWKNSNGDVAFGEIDANKGLER